MGQTEYSEIKDDPIKGVQFKLYIWKESSQRKEMKEPLLHYKLPSQERILRVRLKTGRPSRQYSLRSDCIDIGANQRQQKKKQIEYHRWMYTTILQANTSVDWQAHVVLWSRNLSPGLT
jgi:hypothetical protein